MCSRFLLLALVDSFKNSTYAIFFFSSSVLLPLTVRHFCLLCWVEMILLLACQSNGWIWGRTRFPGFHREPRVLVLCPSLKSSSGTCLLSPEGLRVPPMVRCENRVMFYHFGLTHAFTYSALKLSILVT